MSAQAPAASTISMTQLLAIGTQHRPWAFVPVARGALAQTGYDPELWWLLASNLADLGLRTLAGDELAGLCARRSAVARMPRVTELAERIAALGEDRVPTTELIRNAEAARETLAAKGVDLRTAFDRWRAGLGSIEAFRAADGNVVRRAGGELSHFGDQIGAATRIGAEHIVLAAGSPAPFVVEGVDPPWLLLELAHRTPRLDSGYQPGIRVVQADAGEFFDGCALADLSDVLAEARVECFIGEHAAADLTRALARDAGSPIAGPYMPLRSLRRGLTPGVGEIVRAELTRQDALHREHLSRVHKRDAERDEAWWRRRLTAALGGEGDPLRVLIATCRFTTVLGAMSHDLAQSLRGLGCRVEVLEESSAHRRLSPLAYSRALDAFDPDVIVAPNYTRRDLERVISGSAEPLAKDRVLPAGVPFVVWVQDAMPHLLTTAAGASIGPLDLAMGYVSLEMVERFGYPRAATLPAPMVASAAKFDAARVDPRLRDDLSCDVAMMTHHAETPETLLQRLLGELAGSGETRRMAEKMAPALREIAAQAAFPPGPTASVRALFAGSGLNDESREVLIQNFSLRYVDRLLRHETALWCAAICERRGWRFRIFGKGWDAHSALGKYARAPLAHRDELAAAYAGAGITLHVSAISAVHQRLVECALSGGVPIIRRTQDAESTALWNAILRLLRDEPPAEITDPGDGFGRVLWYDHLASPATARLSSLRQRMGLKANERLSIRDPLTDPRVGPMGPTLPEAEAGWLLGDLRDTSFTSESELEELIELGRERQKWRESLSGGIARRARMHFTHDALASRLLSALKSRAAE